MFGVEPDDQQAYEERHPVHAPYYRSPAQACEDAAREAARLRHENHLIQKAADGQE